MKCCISVGLQMQMLFIAFIAGAPASRDDELAIVPGPLRLCHQPCVKASISAPHDARRMETRH